MYHATKGYINASGEFCQDIEIAYLYPKAIFCYILPTLFFTAISLLAMIDLCADALTNIDKGDYFFPVMGFFAIAIGMLAVMFLGFDIFEDCVSEKYATTASFLICLFIFVAMFFNGHPLTVFFLLSLTILMTVFCGMPGLYKSKTEWVNR